MQKPQPLLRDCQRIIIKIGSALLVDQQSGTLRRSWLQQLLADVATLWQQGRDIVIVSSGAIALGRRHLDENKSCLTLPLQQAAAAMGQVDLVHAYRELLAEYQIETAQILLTLHDSESRQRYLNAQQTLNTLLQLRAIPIINENNSVATAEIRYGDNDRLAARVGQMVAADCLVLLSDVDGLYDACPRRNSDANWLPIIEKITPQIMAMAGDSSSNYGSGGMHTKLAAAKIITASGGNMVILDGYQEKPLQQLLANSCRCSWFLATTTMERARKAWMAQHLQPDGQIIIDLGASNALRRGTSLLAAGICQVQGQFERGALLSVIDQNGKAIARGLVNYPSRELDKIMGQRSDAIATILGYDGSSEVIHRDNLVLIEE